MAVFKQQDQWHARFSWDTARRVEQLVLREIGPPGKTEVQADLCDGSTITGSSVDEVQDHASHTVRCLRLYLDTPGWWKKPPRWLRVVVSFGAGANHAGAEIEGDDPTRVRGLLSRLADEAKRKPDRERRGLLGTVLANRWVFALLSGVAASLIATALLAWAHLSP